MQCLILAGGFASRLGLLTENVPKSMLRIKDRPFLEYQIELLQKKNVDEIILCIGHLGEQIEAYFGNGERFGVPIKYSYENEQLLGTCGALRNTLLLLEDVFFVLYGDSYLNIDYSSIYNHFLKVGCPALLTVYKNENKWDKSNVVFQQGMVEGYDKKGQISGMDFIDYGLAVLSKKIIAAIPKDTFYDLTELYKKLVQEKKLAGYEVLHRFYEIGSVQGLRDFESFIEERGGIR